MTWFQQLSADEQRTVVGLFFTPAGEAARRYAGCDDQDATAEDIEFAAWLVAADRLCGDQHRLSIFDLPDFMWRDCHDDGRSPDEALAEAVAYADGC